MIATPEPTLGQKIKSKVDRALENKNVRFGLTLVGIVAGTYLGVRQPMRQMSSRVKNIDHNLYETSKFVQDAYNSERDFRTNQRRAIEELLVENKGFTHFPGVGVLDHEMFNEIMDKKSS